ncbi:hypothetical protein ACFV29_04235 [Streptomyces sp. NPDC059690]|jgi:hypothetical protein|uniref:hypothetical protein n=1 Tax=Streptomyces sp. NPDC059690 TaxID=3346907 RepID=UPI00369E5746
MRVLLKASMNTEKANDAIRSGKMPQMMEEALGNIKPEAAYFTLDHGVRTAYLVVDLQDSSQMPAMGEPFFLDLGAEIDMTPVMNADDLQKGLSQLR